MCGGTLIISSSRAELDNVYIYIKNYEIYIKNLLKTQYLYQEKKTLLPHHVN